MAEAVYMAQDAARALAEARALLEAEKTGVKTIIMTTTAKKTPKTATRSKEIKATRKAASAKKPPRIRPELLPENARYITVDDIEYIAVPVADFGDWYEDIELGAVAQDRLENGTEPPIPLEEFLAKEVAKERGKAKK